MASGETLTGATTAGTSITNTTGNGHMVTHDSSLAGNAALAGGTCTLDGGGTLTPGVTSRSSSQNA